MKEEQIKNDVSSTKINFKITPKMISFMILIAMLVELMILAVVQNIVIIRLNNKYDRYDEFESMVDTMLEIDAIYESESIFGPKESLEDNMENAIKAFAASYGDKYMGYIDPTEFKETIVNNNSQSTSTGLQIYWEDDIEKYYVFKVEPDSPAEKAGIKVGDYLTTLNGVVLTNDNRTETLNSIPYEEGVEVSYILESAETGEEYEVNLVREVVNQQSVFYSLVGDTENIGYIKITEFRSETDEQFEEAIDYMKANNIDKVIFDVRWNHGGLADAVVPMIDLLCPKGTVLRYIDNEGKVLDEFSSDANEFNADMVVIINSTSASASEVFTQNLRDFGKAYIIGEQSYGKGTVLTELGLSNGGGLVLSTSKYYTNSDTDLEGTGIEPDLTVKLDEEDYDIYYKLKISDDEQIQAAITYLNSLA